MCAFGATHSAFSLTLDVLMTDVPCRATGNGRSIRVTIVVVSSPIMPVEREISVTVASNSKFSVQPTSQVADYPDNEAESLHMRMWRNWQTR